MEQVIAERGRIDVLVNNAGIIRANRIEDIDDADWRSVVDASLTGWFYCTRAVLPHMRLASTAPWSRSRR
jgi:3-oxoacyl-[acyl-carrier protein] reductase